MNNIIKKEELIARKSNFVTGELKNLIKMARPEIENLEYVFKESSEFGREEIVLVSMAPIIEGREGSKLKVDVTADSLLAIAQDVIKAVI